MKTSPLRRVFDAGAALLVVLESMSGQARGGFSLFKRSTLFYAGQMLNSTVFGRTPLGFRPAMKTLPRCAMSLNSKKKTRPRTWQSEHRWSASACHKTERVGTAGRVWTICCIGKSTWYVPAPIMYECKARIPKLMYCAILIMKALNKFLRLPLLLKSTWIIYFTSFFINTYHAVYLDFSAHFLQC